MNGQPAKTHRTTAIGLTNYPVPYLLQTSDDEDSPWKLVQQPPRAERYPSKLPAEEVAAVGKRAAWLPETVTVTFFDGDIRILNPNDPVECGEVESLT